MTTIKYRGNEYPAVTVTYHEKGQPADTATKTLVSTSELDKLLYHDSRCKVERISDMAHLLDNKIGFFLPEHELNKVSFIKKILGANHPDFVFIEVE